MKKYIKSTRIYLEDGCVKGILCWQDGKFAEVLDYDAKVEDYIDVGDNRIIPGIIDTHNHGFMGYNLYFADDQADKEYHVQNYLKALPSVGVTGVLPTARLPFFETIVQCHKEKYAGARILGIHSEGPWLNRVGEKGRPRPYPPVDLDSLNEMIEKSGGLLKVMGLAPEIPGIEAVMEILKKNHIKISFAHSDCNYKETKKAIENGVEVATHLSNVMTGIHHRDIGGTGALLTSDKVQCEIICDGLHVSLPYIEILLKVKDVSMFNMISDNVQLAGIAPGNYPSSFKDVTINVDAEGFIKDSDGRLSGSSKPVIYGIGNLVEKLHIPLSTVLRMSSLNPARFYGFPNKGSIRVGKDADFVVISDDYRALSTYVEGEKMFDHTVDQIVFNPKYQF